MNITLKDCSFKGDDIPNFATICEEGKYEQKKKVEK